MTIKIALPSIQLKLLLLISILIFDNMYANAKEALIFAIDIIRHGDRTPVIELPKAPHSWPEGLGELTAIGLRQEFELGSQLRKQYIDQTKLLHHDYSNASVYVRSTDYNRTLMSAEAFE
ncbi:MAG: histidine phosphatase family protein [Burkholderiales bacterium]